MEADGTTAERVARSERGALGLLCDGFGVVAFALLFLAVAGRVWAQGTGPELLVVLCLAAPLGHLTADLLTGLVIACRNLEGGNR